MNKRLGHIADIQFGSYDKPKVKGTVKYLHAGHFDKLFKPTKFADSYIEFDDKNKKFLLEQNDVILAGKGHRTFAWAYEPSFGKVVPSSIFFIIKANSQEISSRYLALYLNSEKVQHQLKVIGAGGTITSIPKKELEQVAINIPSLKKQEKMVGLIEVVDERLRLTQQMLNKQFSLKTGLINNIIN